MRDRKGKIMTPVISIRRGSIVERDTLKSLGVNNNPAGNDHIHRNKHTKQNKYDRFSALQNRQPKRERYSMVVPTFVDISYSIQIFCDFIEQINGINEMFWDHQGKAWGMEYKFMSSYSSTDLNTSVPSDGDRLVTSNIDVTVKAGLVSKDIDLQPSTGKNITSYNIAFKTRTVSDINNIDNF